MCRWYTTAVRQRGREQGWSYKENTVLRSHVARTWVLILDPQNLRFCELSTKRYGVRDLFAVSTTGTVTAGRPGARPRRDFSSIRRGRQHMRLAAASSRFMEHVAQSIKVTSRNGNYCSFRCLIFTVFCMTYTAAYCTRPTTAIWYVAAHIAVQCSLLSLSRSSTSTFHRNVT